MSILSSIRKSRQSAREYNAKLAAQKRTEDGTTPSSAPYRHIPTHAAADAVASAPPSWREADDRQRIMEQHQKRSSMGPVAHGGFPSPTRGLGPGIPAGVSSLSFVTYPGPGTATGTSTPGGGAGSFHRVPRSYSYYGGSGRVSPYYADGSRDVIYSIPDDQAYHDAEEQPGQPGQPGQAYSTGKEAVRPAQPVRVGTAPGPLPVAALATHAPSRSNSSSSLPGLTPTSTKLPSPPAPASPQHRTAEGVSYFPQVASLDDMASSPPSKATRFAEPSPAASVEQVASVPGAVIVNMLPEPAEEVQTQKKSGRLSKMFRR